MHRSRSLRRLDRVTPNNRHTVHYKRRSASLPHCAICRSELNGISTANRGRSTASNSRKFGGVLCASCSATVIKLASRIEHGEMKMNDIGVRERAFVLQMVSH
jgi:large subunit ribosomal protein L34e